MVALLLVERFELRALANVLEINKKYFVFHYIKTVILIKGSLHIDHINID